MKTALIGYTGFVGSTLDKDLSPTHRYRSTNIEEMKGESFDHVICAGVQAMKWWANLHPEEDMAGIQRLLDVLTTVKAERFTLISSIDVYPIPRDVDENSVIEKNGHHAYGLHRLLVEEWIRDRLEKVCVLRLPGLFGPGLKKNVIYDMVHDNNLEKVHPDGVFQYYDTRQLARDMEMAWNHHIDLLNLSSEPIATHEIRDRFFPDKQLGGNGPAPAGYDMRSLHAVCWQKNNEPARSGYLYQKEEILTQMSDWLSSHQ